MGSRLFTALLCNMVRNLACGMHARIDRTTTPLPSLDARRPGGLNQIYPGDIDRTAPSCVAGFGIL